MLAVTATSASARAEWEPISQRQAVGGDIYWWSAENLGSSLPLVPFVNIELTNSIYLDMQFPFVLWIDGFGDETRAGIGNPTFGVHYADTIDKVSYYLGGRISAPLGANHDDDWQFSDYTALTALAGYDSFLFAVDYLPISGNFGVEIQPIRPIWLRFGLDPIFLFKLPHDRGGFFGDDDRNAVVFGLQSKFEFAGRAEDIGIGGGLALQTVFQVSKAGGSAFLPGGLLPDSDRAQVAVEPFFLYDKGPLFLRLGVLIALDEPLGFGFDEGKVATGHFQIGGRF